MSDPDKQELVKRSHGDSDSMAITRFSRKMNSILDKADFPLTHKFHHVGGHVGKVGDISLSDDCTYLVTSGLHGIYVWDVRNARCLDSFLHHQTAFIDLYAHNLAIIASSSGLNGSTSLLEIGKGDKNPRTIPGEAYCLSPCRRYAFLFVSIEPYDNRIEMYDLETGKIVKKFPAPYFKCSGMSTDGSGRYLVICTTNCQIHILDTETAQITKNWKAGLEGDIQISADMRILMINGWSSLEIWDIARERLIRDVRGPSPSGLVLPRPNVSTLSRDGALIAGATGSEMSKVSLQETSSGKTLSVVEPRIGTVQSLDIAPDNNYLAIGGDDGYAVIWNLVTGRLHKRIGGYTRDIKNICSNGKQHLGYLPATDEFGRGDSEAWRPEKLDIQTGRTVSLEPVRFRLFADDVPVVIGHDHMVVKFEDKIIKYQLSAGKKELTLQHDDFENGVQFIPGTSSFVTARLGCIKRWSLENGESSILLLRQWYESTPEAISPNGRYLAVSYYDVPEPPMTCKLAVIDLDEGEIVHEKDFYVIQKIYGITDCGNRILVEWTSSAVKLMNLNNDSDLTEKVFDDRMLANRLLHNAYAFFYSYPEGVVGQRLSEIWDINEPSCLATFSFDEYDPCIIGRNMFATCSDGGINIRTFPEGTLIARYLGLDNGFLWTTPPEEGAPCGWFWTDRKDLLSIYEQPDNGGAPVPIKPDDPRFDVYYTAHNREDMVMSKLNNQEHYKRLLLQHKVIQREYEQNGSGHLISGANPKTLTSGAADANIQGKDPK